MWSNKSRFTIDFHDGRIHVNQGQRFPSCSIRQHNWYGDGMSSFELTFDVVDEVLCALPTEWWQTNNFETRSFYQSSIQLCKTTASSSSYKPISSGHCPLVWLNTKYQLSPWPALSTDLSLCEPLGWQVFSLLHLFIFSSLNGILSVKMNLTHCDTEYFSQRRPFELRTLISFSHKDLHEICIHFNVLFRFIPLAHFVWENMYIIEKGPV